VRLLRLGEEKRRKKERRRKKKKTTGQTCPVPYGGHNQQNFKI